MRGEIRCLGIVKERVERRKGRISEKSVDQWFIWMVEICIYNNGTKRCEDNSSEKDSERKGSVTISVILSSGGNGRTGERNGAVEGGWEQGGRQGM